MEEWLHHPVTEAFQEFLRKWEESLKDQWASGVFRGPSEYQITANNEALGEVKIIRLILGLEYSQFSEALEDDQRSEDESSMGPRGNG